MSEVSSKRNKITYSSLIILSILFTIGELCFDFVGLYEGASITSVLSAAAISIGAYKSRFLKINELEKASIIYIKKNFDFWNILLSILDVICSFVALFAGVVILGVIFNIGYAGRVLVLIYRFRAVSVPLLGWAIVHLTKKYKRRKSNMEVKTTKTSLPQWITILVAVLGVGYGVLCYFVPDMAILGDQLISVLAGLGIAGVTTVIGVFTKSANKTKEEIQKAVEKSENSKTKKLDKLLTNNPDIVENLRERQNALDEAKDTVAEKETTIEIISETEKPLI